MRQLGESVLKASVRRRGLFEELLPGLGQSKRQPTAIVRIGASVDLTGPDQKIDCPADRGLSAPDLRGHLLQRGWGMHPHRLQKIALLSERPGGDRIAAKLLD